VIADAHVHFFSHRFFAALPGSEKLGWELPGTDPAELAGRWVDELDRNHVGRAALIASVPGDEESVSAAVGKYPDRFYGYYMCNPLAPEALDRAEKALAGGLQGVCFFPAMHRYSIQDERVRAILKLTASRPRTIVFVHCGVLSVGVRKKLGLPSPFDMKYSNPIDLHAVALEFPSLPFVIPHFGAGYFREALMVGDLCPNVYLDTSSSNDWVKYQTETMTLAQVFRRAIDVLGAERLLFGTDSSWFPRGWQRGVYEAQSQAVMDAGVPKAEGSLIFGGNLRRLLSGS
jgi:predicted TIM-barrel fold metal-dependent hydrolase